MYILGLSAYYHDSAACLLKNEEIIAAAQEERFTRKKHDPNFPIQSIKYCLEEAGISINQVDYIAFYDKPILKFERILKTYLAFAPQGLKSFLVAIPLWLSKKILIKKMICEELNYDGPVLFPEHHESHAMSAFYPSPFSDAAFLTIDGVGEWVTTSYGIGINNRIKILADIKFPHSIGLLYSAFTYYTGFKVNSGEYKVMGLAPYGKPVYKDLIFKHLIDVKEDGSFKLNMEYFDFPTGFTMTNDKFHDLFGGPPRKPESNVTQKEMDLAKSIQEVIEEIVLKISVHIRKETGMKNLCLAGGVALNCVSNGKLLRSKIFDNIWIQPASGDAGGALGAAYSVWYQYLNNQRQTNIKSDSMKGSFLGPSFTRQQIRQYLEEKQIPYEEISEAEIPNRISDLIGREKVIGWFNGRMEFGPRALGSRSIIGDARSPKMQEIMNLKIKYRESFRPFAPSVLKEKVNEWFNIQSESPYMLLVANVNKTKQKTMTEEQKQLFGIEKLNIVRSDVPAITHVDYSARIQTVSSEINPLYYKIINKFDEKFNCPMIVNTSFNVRGEPLVCTPNDAYLCFMRTEMDYLFLGGFLIDKKLQQKIINDSDWEKQFELD